MMRSAWASIGLALTLLLPAASARADWATAKCHWDAFWGRVCLDWHRNNAWPEPFQSIDRQNTIVPLAAMVDAGWRLQNTLSDDMFDTETQELTSAGKLKVREILTQYPPPRRTIYVLRGTSDATTSIRMRSAELAASAVSARSQRPEVFVSDIIPRGGSGDYYDRVIRGYQSSTPQPRLPASEGKDK
jgi:hypothetical protein